MKSQNMLLEKPGPQFSHLILSEMECIVGHFQLNLETYMKVVLATTEWTAISQSLV